MTTPRALLLVAVGNRVIRPIKVLKYVIDMITRDLHRQRTVSHDAEGGAVGLTGFAADAISRGQRRLHSCWQRRARAAR